jgi:glycosyltransferase involved in cell wall biosynthesis
VRSEPPPPLVSVVVASYNLARFIDGTLASVGAQTTTRWECVVVDDGSTDGAAEIADSFTTDARFRVIRQANAGGSNTRNRGFDAIDSSSPFVLFLDSDDVLHPTALETMATYLGDHPDVAAVYTDSRIIDDDDVVRPELQAHLSARRFVPRGLLVARVPATEPNTSMETLLASMTARPTCTMFRVDAFRAVGGWDQTTFPWDDNDLMARLLVRERVHFIDVCLSDYRIHGANASSTRLATGPYQRYRAKLWHFAVPPHDLRRIRRSMIFERYLESMFLARQATRMVTRRPRSVPHPVQKAIKAFAACVGMAACYETDRRFGRPLPVWRIAAQLEFCRPDRPRTGELRVVSETNLAAHPVHERSQAVVR